MVISFSFALAAGTGDSPTPIEDLLTADELKSKEAEEVKFLNWLKKHKNDNEVGILVFDEPYGYLYTPSHTQQKSYWCGPATCQIIDDYRGSYVSQSTYASYMGTTSDGTSFAKIDDCLRYYTNKSYYYHGPLANSSDFYARVQYAISEKKYPMAADLKIVGSEMDYYVFDHSGHILCIEGYDARWGAKIKVNDPYDEESWKSGGGDTYGHKTYPASQICKAVLSHWRRAVIY